MKNNIPDIPIIRAIPEVNTSFRNGQHVISSYKRTSNVSRIFTFLGIVLVLYFIYTNLKPPAATFGENDNNKKENIADAEENASYEIKILHSTFKGMNENLNPYQINITKAVRTLDDNYLLEKIDAKYKINSDKELVVKANYGILNEKTQILQLENKVQFILGESILKTRLAQLNLLNKEIFSDVGVVLLFKNSKLTANHFNTIDNNTIINFRGDVTVAINIADF